MDYVTIKGQRLEGTGVVPDIVTPTPKFGEEDKGIAEALRVFKVATLSPVSR
jgi:C-terminal processing protease CtpA/Prc